MTQAPDTQEKRALKAFERLTFFLQAECCPEGYTHDDADRDYNIVEAALEKPVERVDLEAAFIAGFEHSAEGHNGEHGALKSDIENAAKDYVASRHPDLFGGKKGIDWSIQSTTTEDTAV